MKATQTVYVRMPIELFEKIRREARNEHRSVSSQIIYYTEKGVLTEEEKQKASA